MQKVENLLNECYNRKLKIVTAESCTGGMVAAKLTDIAGSSRVFERGFITYADKAKIEMLGISPALIAENGAVSKEVAIAMAEGALNNSHADLSVAITGIAGPDGATDTKSVGLVYIAVKRLEQPAICQQRSFSGNRDNIRKAATEAALDLILAKVIE